MTPAAQAPQRVVVVGGGTMGVGIAAIFALAGDDVALVDDGATATAAAVERARAVAGRVARKLRRGEDEVAAAAGRIAAAPPLADVEPEPALLVEAVPERVDLKRKVLAAAAALAPATLGTNTSGISIAALADGLDAPERLIGLHFFNPVPVMALVEVVVGPATADATRDRALAHVARIGKEAIVVGDVPGFATSRLGLTLGLEAIRMVEQEVASPADIDRAMTLGYRHPIGPLRLTDLVGLDVRLDIARGLQASYGDRFAPPALLEAMVADGRLGQKSGQGFYAW
jgi:3-hydroxyacyl-CoA dehydrogenase